MSTAGAERTGTREGRFAGVRVVDLRQQIGTEPGHSVAVFATQPRTVVSDCARQQRRAQPVLVRCLCTVNTTRIHTVTNISTPSFRTNPPPTIKGHGLSEGCAHPPAYKTATSHLPENRGQLLSFMANSS